jgi:hypothetical protein
MQSNAADSRFPDDPKRAKLPKESPPSAAYSETKSIILEVPIGDVYACCCRVEESPRFIKSLRDVQKIDDTHFLLTYLIDHEPRRTVLQSYSVSRSAVSRGKQSHCIFPAVPYCSSRFPTKDPK